MFIRIVKIAAAAVLLLLIAYYYSLEISKNWDELHIQSLTIRGTILLLAIVTAIASYLLETYAWQHNFGDSKSTRVTFLDSFAVVNLGGVLKYLPGKVWNYAIQVYILDKYGIKKAKVIYVNIICLLCSLFAAGSIGLVYYCMSWPTFSNYIAYVVAIIISFFIVSFFWLKSSMAKRHICKSFTFKNEQFMCVGLQIDRIVYTYFIYLLSWIVMGVAGYLWAVGFGLNVLLNDIYLLLATMSLGWAAGYLAVFTPGGLGVREGVMLLMFNGVLDVQTALLFPVLSRLMSLSAELILGLVALLVGLRRGTFRKKSSLSA
jgi:hypothetical protein